VQQQGSGRTGQGDESKGILQQNLSAMSEKPEVKNNAPMVSSQMGEKFSVPTLIIPPDI
jgi:hypothetical protein